MYSLPFFGIQTNPKGKTLSLLTFENNALFSTVVVDDARPGRTYQRGFGSTSTTVRNISSKFGSQSWSGSSLAQFSAALEASTYNDFNFGTSDFTFEWWNYAAAGSVGDSAIVVFGSTGVAIDARTAQIGLSYKHESRNITLFTANPTTSTTSVNSVFPTNTWFHIAIVRKDGVIKVWVEGVERISVPFNHVLDFTIRPFNIGWDRRNSGFSLYGALDEFRVSNYAVYDRPFIPSTVGLS